MKKPLKDRPFAQRAANIAAAVDGTPTPPAAAQVSTLAMIVYAILDHSDAIRELTAALERNGDER